ncbi:MAG: selenide, water dikinase SelD [Syntrophomonas sp.]|nr:selenide, water dikinase SelD [Syntrophomonas sp.]
MGPGTLEKVLQGFVWPQDPNLMIGIESRDDAGVYRINDELALIQTVDFFTPMVDEPFIFGQIAATNAINDIYAMGGEPLLAMNVVCYPQCGDMDMLRQILAGGLSKIEEAGALLVGGHTVDDNEPKYGLSVCGRVHPARVIANNTAGAGDVLFLSKPLGNGIICTAIKAEMASQSAIDEAIKWMSMLNQNACRVMQRVGVSAATDITGFGLIGHLFELAVASDVEVELDCAGLRFMQGVMEYANLGLIPAGAYTNREYLVGKVEYCDEIDPALREVLYSPETAGGVLVAVDKSKADIFQEAMQEEGCFCCRIGSVLGAGFKPIKIKSR